MTSSVLVPSIDAACSRVGAWCSNRGMVVGGIVVALAVGVVFGRTLGYGWLNWDDPINVTENPHLNPVTARGLVDLWLRPYAGLYIPVAYMLYAAETLLSRWWMGLGPTDVPAAWPFHVVSLALHAYNGLVVLGLLHRRLGFSAAAATAGAMLFAAHPLQVEAVAWISDQRGLLATALGLTAVWMHLAAQADRDASSVQGRAWFQAKDLAAGLVFCLAMLAKPQVAPLPVIALALGIAAAPKLSGAQWSGARVVCLVPWAAIIIGLTVVSRSQQPGEAGGVVVAWWQRLIVAGDALMHYAGKLICPVDLAVDYGRGPDVVVADPRAAWRALGAWLVAAVLLAWPWLGRIRLAAFVGSMGLAPTLGFIPFVHQGISTVADRYAYVAMLGPAIAGAALWDAAVGRRAALAIRTALIAGLTFAGLVAWSQIPVWRTSETLFRHSARVNPRSFFAQLNLGNALLAEGHVEEAVPILQSAVEASLEYKVKYKPHASLAQALHRLGQRTEAAKEYRRAIALAPDWANLHNDYGVLLAEEGDFCAAAERFREALRLGLDTAAVRRNLAAAEGGCRDPSAGR